MTTKEMAVNTTGEAPDETGPSSQTESVPPGRGPGRLAAGRKRLLTVVGAVVVIALVAGSIFLFVGARQARADQDARHSALKAAKTRVPKLLSYSYRTLADDAATELAQTTGSFHDDYAALLKKVVKPTATEKQISTTAKVTAAGVVRGDSDRVTVLVFLTQSTTGKGSTRGVTGSRVEVTMKPTADGWKIAALKTV